MYISITKALFGSGLISEMFLITILLAGSYRFVGVLILASRIAHCLPACYIFYRIIGPEPQSAYFVSLLSNDHMLQNSKSYGFLGFLSLLEVSLLRFLPWRDSDFSEAAYGFPVCMLCLLCLYVILVCFGVCLLCLFVCYVFHVIISICLIEHQLTKLNKTQLN